MALHYWLPHQEIILKGLLHLGQFARWNIDVITDTWITSVINPSVDKAIFYLPLPNQNKFKFKTFQKKLFMSESNQYS
jgi:hypothetical protein